MDPWVGCADWSYDISPDGSSFLTLNMMQLYYAFTSRGRIFYCDDVNKKAWDEIKYIRKDEYPIRVVFVQTNELIFYHDREVDYLFKVSDFTGWDFTDFALIGIVSVDYNGTPGLVCSQFKPYIRSDQDTSEDYMMIGTVNNTGADVTTFMEIGCLFTLKQYRYIGYANVVNSQLDS